MPFVWWMTMLFVLSGSVAIAEQADLEGPQSAGKCSKVGAFAVKGSAPQWTGWGGSEVQHRFQPADRARISAVDVPRLKLKWAFGFPGANQAYSQPSVAGGRVFIGSAGSKVYSLDAYTGCIYWEFPTYAGVRSAITVAPHDGRWAAFFADVSGNVYAVDARVGTLLWKAQPESHPAARITASPTFAAGRLYVAVSSVEEVTDAGPRKECCTFRGSVASLDAATGRILWKAYTIPIEPRATHKNQLGTQLWGPSGAAVWSAPTIDLRARRVYVTTGDSYSDPVAETSDAVLAFELDTGKLLWARQTTAGDGYNISCGFPPPANTNCPQVPGHDLDFGSSAILVNLPSGGRALIAGQKSGAVYSLDPDHEGRIRWQTQLGRGGTLGGIQWGPAVDDQHVYVALSDAKADLAPPGTAGAQPSAFGLPVVLDPKVGGGLFALDLRTGKILWHTPHPGCLGKPGCSPAQSAAVTVIPGVVFSGGLDGHLRAYSTQSGQIIWDVDTVSDYDTINRVPARGGSLDGPGAVVVDGLVYVNSGYGFAGGMPGNVLLAFSVDGT
jgi:polyvinyl alcohol dehydrogenase (cytochrome)